MSPSLEGDYVERLAEVFRALSDPARLRILGAIAEQTRSGSELSDLLNLSPPTISHHIAKLTAAGLIATTPDAQRRLYSLNTDTLRSLARSSARSGSATPDSPNDEADRERSKTNRDFFKDGVLKQIPAQRRKRVFVLQHLMERFAPRTDYSEKTVNEMLKRAHPDFATLRRELVDYGFMTRENGVYRVAESLPSRGPNVAQEISGDEHDWLRTLVDGALSADRHDRSRKPARPQEKIR
jgi:DNA-binding transcriptional ArsR family regulator